MVEAGSSWDGICLHVVEGKEDIWGFCILAISNPVLAFADMESLTFMHHRENLDVDCIAHIYTMLSRAFCPTPLPRSSIEIH